MPAPFTPAELAQLLINTPPIPVIPVKYSNNGTPSVGVETNDGTFNDASQDAQGVWCIPSRVKLGLAPNRGLKSINAFWNNVAAGIGAASAAVQVLGNWGKGKLYVNASAATNITVQVSPDGGTTWYTLQTSAGSAAFTLAFTAAGLLAIDLPGIPGDQIRLVTSAAVTLTAGYEWGGV